MRYSPDNAFSMLPRVGAGDRGPGAGVPRVDHGIPKPLRVSAGDRGRRGRASPRYQPGFVGEHDGLNPVAQAEFASIRPIWIFTVPSDRSRLAAISLLDMPGRGTIGR